MKAGQAAAKANGNPARVELARAMGADFVMLAAAMPAEKERKEFVFSHSLNHVGADVVINTVGTTDAFRECFNFVRDSGTIVEVGNFVDSGTFAFNPCKHLCERGIKIIGSFDNEAEHFVRAMPLISNPHIPLEKLISHQVPLADVETVLAAIEKGAKLDNKEIVKAMMVPELSERN